MFQSSPSRAERFPKPSGIILVARQKEPAICLPFVVVLSFFSLPAGPPILQKCLVIPESRDLLTHTPENALKGHGDRLTDGGPRFRGDDNARGWSMGDSSLRWNLSSLPLTGNSRQTPGKFRQLAAKIWRFFALYPRLCCTGT